ncbi:MAG: helix-turn-helix domain-containing protein [Pseudomonadota bacterium]
MTNLTILRKRRGLTQADLARILGVPRQTVNQLENRWLRRLRPDVEDQLRKFFGKEWTMDALLKEPTVPEPPAQRGDS